MKKVLLVSEFGNKIFTRNSMSNFFKKINKLKEKEIEFDFNDMDFITRSCADEYVKQKGKSKKIIVEVNISKKICSMFEVVKNQYKEKNIPLTFEIISCQKVKNPVLLKR